MRVLPAAAAYLLSGVAIFMLADSAPGVCEQLRYEPQIRSLVMALFGLLVGAISGIAMFSCVLDENESVSDFLKGDN